MTPSIIVGWLYIVLLDVAMLWFLRRTSKPLFWIIVILKVKSVLCK